MSEYENRGLGLIQSEPDPRDFIFGAAYKAESLPERFLTDVSGIQVHDQGKYQNCGTHALSAHVEIGLQKAGKYQKVSFPWYYGNRRYSENKGEGTEARGLLKAAQKDGGLYLADYPYEEEVPKAIETFEKYFESLKTKAQNIRIKNYYQCVTADEVKRAVYYYGSVLVGTIVFKSFYEITAENPIMPEPRIDGTSLEPMAGGHMMLIVGWDKQGFTVLNSWGEGFGKKGLFTMPYSIVDWSQRNNFPLPLFEAWAVDGVYIDGKLLETGKEPVTPPTPSGDDGWYKQSGKWRYRENGKDVFGKKGLFTMPYSIVDWSQRNNFPLPLFEAWAVDGVYIDGKLLETGKEPVTPPTPSGDDGWYKQSGKWRYRENGKDVVGWKKVQGIWYYLDSDGYMATGWVKVDGKWYFLKSSGAMATGWLLDKNKWYYLKSNGEMAVGWLKDKEKWYYLKSSGAMAVGWLKDKGEWYYLNADGSMQQNWKEIDGRWYWFDASGKAAKGFQTINGKDYYFAEKWFEDVKECQMIKTDSSGAIV